mmetsp:Transcript_29843/g.75060  ORF Transcript_29843/g.75060 Transcript_29843/m.75060 type:complete len:710 (+) Transcript_29843:208-2337(+)|eukprot:CAMPEP_0177649718 /NCGR_PEP_ID=MMETSP0447-20121125/11543_1 /TAXON_ID=0 /ORGANISM="Stygamoeba regulata, Strain BSH-02190019" /LENGTH=709 /DNA_ID=CAMNT_0019152509 /DNA_START=176 /DNA_END=2305 /DNA_ORIENTATION=+
MEIELEAVHVHKTDSEDDGVSTTSSTGETTHRHEMRTIPAERQVDYVFRDVYLTMRKRRFRKATKVIPVLRGISGRLRAGRTTAIMGASGAGKTSALNVLAGRIKASRERELTGDLLVNGEAVSASDLKHTASYVMQDDVFLYNMTVREQIRFAADMSLPPSRFSAQAKRDKVADILDQLRLNKAAETQVGQAGVQRGISGGERKRCAIGVELVNDSPLLFLDEPTSGLDSDTAAVLIEHLGDLAHRGGRTVVFTIHQPSSEVFHMFDDLILLSEGQVVYQGEAAGLADYLASLGHPVPVHSNPADFVLKLLNDAVIQAAGAGAGATATALNPAASSRVSSRSEVELEESDGGTLSSGAGAGAGAGGRGIEDMSTDRSDTPLVGDLRSTRKLQKRLTTAMLVDQYDTWRKSEANLQPAAPEHGFTRVRRERPPLRYQLWYLFCRTMLSFVRNKPATIGKLFQYVFVGVFSGVLFWQQGTDTEGVQGRNGAMFSSILLFSFMPANGTTLLFPLERPVFLREHAKKMYHPLTYYISKTLTEAPFQLLCVLLAMTPTYFMIGLKTEVDTFFMFMLVVMMVSLVGSSIGLIVGAGMKDIGKAMELGPSLIIPPMLSAGLFVNLDAIPVVLRWFSDVSFVRWAFQALMNNEWANTEVDQSVYAPNGNGDEILEFYNYAALNYWECVGILAGFVVFFRIVAYFLFWLTAKRSSSE